MKKDGKHCFWQSLYLVLMAAGLALLVLMQVADSRAILSSITTNVVIFEGGPDCSTNRAPAGPDSKPKVIRNFKMPPPPPSERRQMTQEDFLWHYLVSPKAKLMFCMFYKTASSQIAPLFHRLEGDPDWRSLQFGKLERSEEGCEFLKKGRNSTYRIPSENPPVARCSGLPRALLVAHQFQPLETKATDLVYSDDYFKAVLVRDPLDRFISGMMDKCVDRIMNPIDTSKYKKDYMMNHCKIPQLAGQWHIVYNKTRDEGLLDKYDVTRRMLPYILKEWEQLFVKYGPNKWHNHLDMHFKPQSLTCGLNKGIPMDYVLRYDTKTLSSDMEDLFDEAGIGRHMNDGWGRGGSDEKLFQDFSNSSSKGIKRRTLSTDPLERMRRVFTRDQALRFERLFAVDYETFEEVLSRPSEFF